MADPRMLALQFFTQRGYSPAQAAGIVGNLVQESGQGLNTRAVHDGGTGLGIAGWRDPSPGQGRRTALRQFAASQGADVHDLTTQLSFVDHELQGPESRVGTALRAAQDPASAARAFISFERPQGWTAATPERGHGFGARVQNADQLYAAFTGGGSLPKAMPAAGGGPAQPTTLAQSFQNPGLTQTPMAPAAPNLSPIAQMFAVDEQTKQRQALEVQAEKTRRAALFGGPSPFG
jgi:hypothetical protein